MQSTQSTQHPQTLENVKMFKLVSGEVIMGVHHGDLATDVVIEILNPSQLILDPTNHGVGMIPYCAAYSQKEMPSVIISELHIIHEIEVGVDFLNAYTEFRMNSIAGSIDAD